MTHKHEPPLPIPPPGGTRLTLTEAELAAALTEWDLRYRSEPERFMSEAARLLYETPKTYGDACAPYLLSILQEQRHAAPLPIFSGVRHYWPREMVFGGTTRFNALS